MPSPCTIDGIDGYRGVSLEAIGVPPGSASFAAWHLGRYLKSIGAPMPTKFTPNDDSVLFGGETLPIDVDGVIYIVNVDTGEVKG